MPDVGQQSRRQALYGGASRPRWLAAVGLGAAFALALAACGSGSSTTTTTGSEFLNTAQTRRAIEASILEQRNLHATVLCPSEVVREKGIRFDCVATTTNGVRTVFHVVEANSRGYVEYASSPEKKQIAKKQATTTSTTRHKKP